MMMVTPKSYSEQLRELVEQYRRSGQSWPTDAKTMASWLVRQQKWAPTRKSAIDQLAPLLSRAMREELFDDPQGRRVRKKHAVRETHEEADGTYRQMVIWVDIDDPETDPKRMHGAFQLRRGQVLGDCRQLKTDVDSYNDNYNQGSSIDMLWDFTDDLLELEQSSEYPSVPRDDDEMAEGDLA